MRVAFHTLGCKVNQCDTEAFTEQFMNAGWDIVAFDDVADVYVVATCTVTATADKKSRQFISRAVQRGIVIATGCYAQRSADELKKLGVSVVIGNHNRNNIVELAQLAIDGHNTVNVENICDITEFEELYIQGNIGKTRALIKVQEGCNNHCTYCIIPSVRGRSRSRKLDGVIAEAERLAANGFKEIVLTGICLSAYNCDGVTLDGLVHELNKVEGIERIRLGSLEPGGITEEIASRLSRAPKLCHHFHVSLQSGSDSVLKRMGRKYTAEEYAHEIGLLRKYMPDVSITTDVIVGFAGETEEEFAETCEYVERMNFTHVHLFPYSVRPGTPAAKLKNIDMSIKKTRLKYLQEICDQRRKDYLKGFVGTTQSVLVERSNELHSYGLTQQYIEVELDRVNEGTVVDVVINRSEDILYGKVSDSNE